MDERLVIWTAIYAIANCLLVIGIGIAIWQIIVTRENTRRSTSAQLAIELFREFRSEETKNILRFIYQLSTEKIQQLNTEDLYKIESVLDKFQFIGDLVKRGIIEKRFAIQLTHSALRCWYKLHKYIRKQREKRGSIFEDCEGYIEYCINYHRNTGFKVLFQREGGTDNINLVIELQNEEIRPRSFERIRKDALMTK